MDTPPPIPSYQNAADESHLNLLVVFHFIFAFFSLLGLGILIFQFTVMSALASTPQIANDPQVPKGALVGIMGGIFIFLGFMVLVFLAMNTASAFFLQARKNRMFSMVTAGLNCLSFPLGTALGVFTFIVLTRDSVRQKYGEFPSLNS